MPRYVIDINHSDDLYNIVRKCNTNFRAISAQVERQGQVNGADIQDDITDLQNQIDGLDIPSKVSDLVNDGDGTSGSRFATEKYVDDNGGKINSITVNGTPAPPDANKNVALTVPTKVSDITNDSGFQDANDVSGAISDALANGTDPYMTESEVQAAIDEASASAFRFLTSPNGTRYGLQVDDSGNLSAVAI